LATRETHRERERGKKMVTNLQEQNGCCCCVVLGPRRWMQPVSKWLRVQHAGASKKAPASPPPPALVPYSSHHHRFSNKITTLRSILRAKQQHFCTQQNT
jgi:hypothetical protein